MGSQSNLTTQLVKHPKPAARKLKLRDPAAPRIPRGYVRYWSASLILTALGVLMWLLWDDHTAPYESPLAGEIGYILAWLAGLSLVFSTLVIVAEARAQPALRAKLAEVSELRASRGRLVDASDAARRSIERDLHDGVQPRLVALLLNVSMARRAGQLDGAPAVINDIEHELHEILSEIRALASGILPPALTDLGLEAAVTELTGRMPFHVDLALPAERLPERAEVTAYFVIAEALTNAAKHAEPTRVSVRVAIHSDRATVVVHDDGRGGADANGGTGLLGLADRVDTLDGRLTVASSRSAGTTVTAEFSCAS